MVSGYHEPILMGMRRVEGQHRVGISITGPLEFDVNGIGGNGPEAWVLYVINPEAGRHQSFQGKAIGGPIRRKKWRKIASGEDR